jgi:hypothetical protein
MPVCWAKSDRESPYCCWRRLRMAGPIRWRCSIKNGSASDPVGSAPGCVCPLVVAGFVRAIRPSLLEQNSIHQLNQEYDVFYNTSISSI